MVDELRAPDQRAAQSNRLTTWNQINQSAAFWTKSTESSRSRLNCPAFSIGCSQDFPARNPNLILRGQVARRMVERANHHFRLIVSQGDHPRSAGGTEAAAIPSAKLSAAFVCGARPHPEHAEGAPAGSPAVLAVGQADPKWVAANPERDGTAQTTAGAFGFGIVHCLLHGNAQLPGRRGFHADCARWAPPSPGARAPGHAARTSIRTFPIRRS